VIRDLSRQALRRDIDHEHALTQWTLVGGRRAHDARQHAENDRAATNQAVKHVEPYGV
jgi:hypothetical protein